MLLYWDIFHVKNIALMFVATCTYIIDTSDILRYHPHYAHGCTVSPAAYMIAVAGTFTDSPHSVLPSLMHHTLCLYTMMHKFSAQVHSSCRKIAVSCHRIYIMLIHYSVSSYFNGSPKDASNWRYYRYHCYFCFSVPLPLTTFFMTTPFHPVSRAQQHSKSSSFSSASTWWSCYTICDSTSFTIL